MIEVLLACAVVAVVVFTIELMKEILTLVWPFLLLAGLLFAYCGGSDAGKNQMVKGSSAASSEHASSASGNQR